MFDFGLLGINARNLDYVKKFNPRKGIRLADDKNRTKRFLSQGGIPVAETYGRIRNEDELRHFDFDALPDKFVAKPNRWSKGRGIMIVRKIKGEPTKFKTSGAEYERDEFQRRLSDILQGEYSVTSGSDTVLIEETLVPSDSFSAFCEHGLADIRVIVFNLVPVAAMVRMPTDRSDGKANLAQGGVGFWLNVGSGEVTSCFVDRRYYSTRFPKGYAPYEKRKIPHWNAILLHSSEIQLFTNLGYLALDWVITPEGPKLLEINARAWLEIQNVCGIPLKDRLEKLGKMKVADPEKGVEIAKTLFDPEKRPTVTEERVLYLSQNAKLIPKTGAKRTVVAKIGFDQEETLVHASIADLATEGSLEFESGTKISLEPFSISERPWYSEIILWRSAVKDFFIRPVHKAWDGKIAKCLGIPEDEVPHVLEVDREISELSKKLNVTAMLRPKNYYEELDAFIAANGEYDPFFKYDLPSPETLSTLWSSLESCEETIRKHLRSSKRLANAYVEKIRELKIRIELAESVAKQDFSSLLEANVALYGGFSKNVNDFSKKKPRKSVGGEILSKDEISKAVFEKLREIGYPEIPVRFVSREGSRIAVSVGDSPRINVSEDAKIRDVEIAGTLEHEIWTHLVRRMNGGKTGLKLFQSGTWFYLRDEEGLAVFRSLKTYENPEDRDGHAFKYEICRRACGTTFSWLAQFVRNADPERWLERVFKACLRAKRWVCDTSSSHQWAAFLKDKVYLDGLEKIEKWVSTWGDPERLLVGKIKIEDLPLFE